MAKLVYIIGSGPGAGRLLTGEAREALEQSECVIGAGRLLDSFAGLVGDRETLAVTTDTAVIQALKHDDRRVYAVLVSGDSGFFSLSRRLLPLIREEGWEARVICGVSSVAYFASRLGVSYDDALVRSFHGRLRAGSGVLERERLLNELTGLAAQNGKCFFLTDGVLSPELVCRTLSGRGLGELRMSVGERLSYPDEKISTDTIDRMMDGAAGMKFGAPNIICVENDDAGKNQRVDLRDASFFRGAVPMTKEDVRAVSLEKLRLKADSICWDIGAGTGAVSCAVARAVPYGRVYAVEREADAIDLIRRNKQKFGCYNLEPVEGAAPSVLAGLPPPDSVFIGGTGGALEGIIREIRERNPGVRAVINAVTLETLAEARTLIEENGFSGAEIIQIGVSAAQKAGGYSMLKARNPVFVISFGGVV
ncbi:MAG: precorrin-6y C5,15-methyltransferase (decarboxylating) subunit CbiE [Spirochaetaceae bacterium]|jgi:precorrin-6Y C5,15-methyltransferase (decarboxylating)|nr:precorrin-6y C5,15-methyltransferase (decarboxylating) subunit CbiE [Spirochaetaceae bacterium]